MRPKFWDLEADSRFDLLKHYEFPVYDDKGNVVREERLTSEGTELAHLIFKEKMTGWDNSVPWFPTTGQGRYIIAISPDQVRHAMDRTETRPRLFEAENKAICETSYKPKDWKLMVSTSTHTVYMEGVITCPHCLGILVFSDE